MILILRIKLKLNSFYRDKNKSDSKFDNLF